MILLKFKQRVVSTIKENGKLIESCSKELDRRVNMYTWIKIEFRNNQSVSLVGLF